MSDNAQPVGLSEPHTEPSTLPSTGNVPSTATNNATRLRKRKRGDNNELVSTGLVSKGGPAEAGPSSRTRAKRQALHHEGMSPHVNISWSDHELNIAEERPVELCPEEAHEAQSHGRTLRDTDSRPLRTLDPGPSELNAPAADKKKPRSKPQAKTDPTELHDSKPEPSGMPQVWAEKRSALCNALPYFRSHQSSLYSHNGVAVGMLIDAKVGDHDIFSSQVIITTM